MDQEHVIILVCTIILLLGLGIGGYLIWKCNSENFCGACQGMGMKTNPDRAKLRKMYQEGKLTENTGFKSPSNWQSMPWDNFLDKEGKKPVKTCDNGKRCC